MYIYIYIYTYVCSVCNLFRICTGNFLLPCNLNSTYIHHRVMHIHIQQYVYITVYVYCVSMYIYAYTYSYIYMQLCVHTTIFVAIYLFFPHIHGAPAINGHLHRKHCMRRNCGCKRRFQCIINRKIQHKVYVHLFSVLNCS